MNLIQFNRKYIGVKLTKDNSKLIEFAEYIIDNEIDVSFKVIEYGKNEFVLTDPFVGIHWINDLAKVDVFSNESIAEEFEMTPEGLLDDLYFGENVQAGFQYSLHSVVDTSELALGRRLTFNLKSYLTSLNTFSDLKVELYSDHVPGQYTLIKDILLNGILMSRHTLEDIKQRLKLSPNLAEIVMAVTILIEFGIMDAIDLNIRQKLVEVFKLILKVNKKYLNYLENYEKSH